LLVTFWRCYGLFIDSDEIQKLFKMLEQFSFPSKFLLSMKCWVLCLIKHLDSISKVCVRKAEHHTPNTMYDRFYAMILQFVYTLHMSLLYDVFQHFNKKKVHNCINWPADNIRKHRWYHNHWNCTINSLFSSNSNMSIKQ